MMIVVPLIILLVPLGITAVVGRYFWNRHRPISYFLIVWCIAAIALNAFPFYPGQGVWVEGDRMRTPFYLLIMASPVLIYLWAFNTSEAVRNALNAVPLHLLAASQLYRIAGVTFIFGFLGGLFPAEIAFPAAFLDTFIAVTALPLAYLLRRRIARGIATAWNLIGLFDFGFAISLVLLSVYGIISLTPAPSALGQLPSILTTVFAVPFGVMVHIEFLRRLRQVTVSQESVVQMPTDAS